MEKLTVLECDYVYNAWRVDKKEQKIISEVKTYQQRKATDDYQLCGVYHKAHIPFDIQKVTRDFYPHEEPYQAVPHAFSDLSYEAISKGNKLLISSGYCIYAPAIVGGIQRAIGEDKKIGVVWIDAHGDNVIVEKTPRDSITLVGVPLSTIMGQTMDTWRKEACVLNTPIQQEHVLVSDARCSDAECQENLRNTKAQWLSGQDFEDENRWVEAVKTLADNVDAIYLMVDVDILKSKYVPAYFRNEEGGHDIDVVMRNVRHVMETDKVIAFSCFCVDFDKYECGGDTTYLNGMKIVAAGLSSWKKRPSFHQ